MQQTAEEAAVESAWGSASETETELLRTPLTSREDLGGCEECCRSSWAQQAVRLWTGEDERHGLRPSWRQQVKST